MKRLARDVLLMACATALSRVFGLLRDVAIANGFGAGAAYDAFLIAFFIPHFLRQLLAEGALSTAVVPVYTGLIEEGGGETTEADCFVSNLITWLLVFFPVLIAGGWAVAPTLVSFLASGFPVEKLDLTIRLARIVFPYIALISLSAVVMAVLNAHRKFLAASLAPVWYNIGMLVGITVLAPRLSPGILGVGLGVLLGGVAHFSAQLPALIRTGFRLRLHLFPIHPRLRTLLTLMAPAVLTMAVAQINFMVDNKLASYLPDGGISALQFAMRLFQLPLGVLAVSIATALLPRFSRAWARRDTGRFMGYLNEGIVANALILLPAMVGLLILGQDAIRWLFEHGSFGATDTVRTARVLSYYLFGLAPYGWVYVLSRAAVARGKPIYPLLASLVAVGANVVLDLLLVGPMQEAGLALATAVAGICNAAMLGVLFFQRGGLSRDTLIRLAWILGGCALLAGTTLGLKGWMAGQPAGAVVLVPSALGVALYAGYVRLTPLWDVVKALRAPEVTASSEAG